MQRIRRDMSRESRLTPEELYQLPLWLRPFGAFSKRKYLPKSHRNPHVDAEEGRAPTLGRGGLGSDAENDPITEHPSESPTQVEEDGVISEKPSEHKHDLTNGNASHGQENSHIGNDDGHNPRRRGGKLKSLFGKKKDEEPATAEVDDGNGKRKPHYTFGNQIQRTLLNSWINVLLLAVPVGIALHPAGVDPIIVFVVNFIAIIPLASMLAYATEEIALRTGETIGGLLNATFGNAVELIVSIIALVGNQVTIVKTSLIGSMLSNLLLVMGMCFFFGGINRMEQNFNVVVAQTASSLLALAIGALIIPTAFDMASATDTSTSSQNQRDANLAPLSRGTAVLLLVVYGCYLFFQLKTHISVYNAPSEKVEKRASSRKKEGDASKGIANAASAFTATTVGDRIPSPATQNSPRNENGEYDDDDEEVPQLSLWVAMITLAVSTVFVAICAEFLVDSINAVSEHISKEFVGLILLPIVGNAAEHATAVTVAVKDKMDLAIGVAVGSSMQIALLVLPLAVIIGWIIGREDMTLFFDDFQIAVLFIAILLVNYLIQDGKSHWLEGVLLMALYVIIALACWFYAT